MISTRSPASIPFLTGTLTAVVGLINFITQNSVSVSLDNTADFGSDAALTFAYLIRRALATRFSGIGALLFTFNIMLCVCAAVSTDGIDEETKPLSLVPSGNVSGMLWPFLT